MITQRPRHSFRRTWRLTRVFSQRSARSRPRSRASVAWWASRKCAKSNLSWNLKVRQIFQWSSKSHRQTRHPCKMPYARNCFRPWQPGTRWYRTCRIRQTLTWRESPWTSALQVKLFRVWLSRSMRAASRKLTGRWRNTLKPLQTSQEVSSN